MTQDNLIVVNHPLIQHKLSILRSKDTGKKEFRELVCEMATLMAYEATRDLPLKDVEIETPLKKDVFQMVDGKPLAVVPILRAGLGMVDGVMALVPGAAVGHIGMYRDHETLEPVEYYCKLPPDIETRLVILLDPMLATGGTTSAAIRMIKERGAQQIKLMSILAAVPGVERIQRDHPDVTIICGNIDPVLNEQGYIVPGLGDAGDRLFGTL